MSDDDYVYDEESGDWLPAAELAERRRAASQVEVRDAVGNLLADGDQVTLIKGKREIPRTCSVEWRGVKDVSTKEEVDTWRWPRWAPMGSRL